MGWCSTSPKDGADVTEAAVGVLVAKIALRSVHGARGPLARAVETMTGIMNGGAAEVVTGVPEIGMTADAKVLFSMSDLSVGAQAQLCICIVAPFIC